MTTLLGSSGYDGAAIDYVLIDSSRRHRPRGHSYFPRTTLSSGTGSYGIEHDPGGFLETGQFGSFPPADIINVLTIQVTPGATEYIRVVPSAELDVDLTVHSATATASTWIQGRVDAEEGSATGGAGVAEQFVYTVPADAATMGALVLMNAGGLGTYNVYRDTTAATGSVLIDNDDATTTSTSATLSIAASDAETRIQDMRISTDGAVDSEPWEPYVTSRAVTLPAGSGTKTVIVQFRNNAGMLSAPVSDTIELITTPGAPTVTSTAPAAGAITVSFSPGSNGGSAVTSYLSQCGSSDGGTSGTTTGTTSPLTVTGLTAAKTYRCRVRAINGAGTGAYGAYSSPVVLPAVPPAPSVTTTTGGAQKVTVAFAPNGDGGSSISSYQVQCTSTDGGTNRSASGTASPLTVTGLSAGKTYRCRVRASNTVGTGAYGAYGANVVTNPTAAPATPTVTNTTIAASGGVRVAFASGGDGGSPITGYTAQCVSTDGGGTRNLTGPASPLIVAGLSGGKDYHCRVRATNAIGNSPYSAYGGTVLNPATAPGGRR